MLPILFLLLEMSLAAIQSKEFCTITHGHGHALSASDCRLIKFRSGFRIAIVTFNTYSTVQLQLTSIGDR